MQQTQQLHPATVIAASLIAGHGLHAVDAIGAAQVAVRFAAAPTSAGQLGPVNHSCDPNLRWADARTLVTVDDLAAGTELTLDYATVLDDPDFVLYCHCETYRCRQVIEGTDWQIPQLQKRYAGYWTPVLERRIHEMAHGVRGSDASNS